MVRFLGGAKQVLILHRPVVYQGTERVHPNYLVIRQDQVQACEFMTPETGEAEDATRDDFR